MSKLVNLGNIIMHINELRGNGKILNVLNIMLLVMNVIKIAKIAKILEVLLFALCSEWIWWVDRNKNGA